MIIMILQSLKKNIKYHCVDEIFVGNKYQRDCKTQLHLTFYGQDVANSYIILMS